MCIRDRYLVTDPELCEDFGLVETVMHAIKGGVTSVQLRDKNISTKSMIKQGLVLKEKLQEQNIPLIINDDVEAAISIGADSVHVGQSDMDVKDVRKEVGS